MSPSILISLLVLSDFFIFNIGKLCCKKLSILLLIYLSVCIISAGMDTEPVTVQVRGWRLEKQPCKLLDKYFKDTVTN